MYQEEYETLFKIIIVGDSGCGKTCLIKRFSENKFESDTKSTIGMDFQFKTVQVDGRVIKLQIWDTAGQERFKSLTTAYYRGSHALIAVFDCTAGNGNSQVESLQYWVHQAKNNGISHEKPIFICANKIDLLNKKDEHVFQEVIEFCNINQFPLFQTSAKENVQVLDMFMELTKRLISTPALHNHEEEAQYVSLPGRGVLFGGASSNDVDAGASAKTKCNC